MKSANKKNSGGNQMSLMKSATRRLSLLAGSSLIAASLSISFDALRVLLDEVEEDERA